MASQSFFDESNRSHRQDIKKPFSFDDEDDNDWNSSKIKGFTFNDDDDETPFQDLEQYRSSSILNNVTSSGNKSHQKSEEFVISFDSTRSGPISDRVKHTAAKSRFGPFDSQTISQSLENCVLPADKCKLEEQCIFLHRQIEKMRQSQFIPLHPKETIYNILMDKDYSFEAYKTFDIKKDLMDAAIEIGDGNAILAVALFLKRTLNHSKFVEVLSTRPVAVAHMSNYMETRNMLKELSSLLTSLGRDEDAACLSYKSIFAESSNIEQKLKRLKSFLPYSHSDHQNWIIEHIGLLERISVIHSSVNIPECQQVPSSFESILDCQTVLSCLGYLSFYYPKTSENLLYSPIGFSRHHKLTDKQRTWVGIFASASRKSWSDVNSLATTKSWLGGIKANSCLDFIRLVKILKEKYDAPTEELIIYLNLIEPLEDRMELALKIKASSVVVDCYAKQKDRMGLIKYKDNLVKNSPEWIYADNILTAGNVKWRN